MWCGDAVVSVWFWCCGADVVVWCNSRCCGVDVVRKSTSQFESMEVRNKSFAAYIDVFTPNTYVMVVQSDTSIRMLPHVRVCTTDPNSIVRHSSQHRQRPQPLRAAGGCQAVLGPGRIGFFCSTQPLNQNSVLVDNHIVHGDVLNEDLARLLALGLRS